MPLLRHAFPCYVTPLRFKAVQNHCVPWPLPASRCIAIASRLKANPLRAFAARLHASPSRFDSSQYHCQTMLCCSVRRHCFSAHCFAIPWLYIALPYAASPPLRIASPYHAVAFPGASRRLISMPSHRVSLLLNTSPSLCETSPSCSISALRQSPLFHCVAEIRIAPRSLRRFSRPKTEFSRAYAVLDCAALHLSVAIFALHHSAIHRLASLCSSFAAPRLANLSHCPRAALTLRHDSNLCIAMPYSAFPLLRHAELSCAVAVLFNSLPFRCCA